MTLFDTHCHLNSPRYDRDLPDVLGRARAAGVGQALIVGYDLESSRRAVAMADPEQGLFASAGIHPHAAACWSPEVESELRELLDRPGVVALGEIGLDYYRDLSPRDAQARAFAAQLEIAADRGLPVIIHTRDSIPDTLETLARFGGRVGGVLHCWSGNLEQTRRALGLGWYLGFDGPVTYKQAEELREVLRNVPGERLVLETDCPYLTPEPYRGQRNEPAYLREIATRVAVERGTSLDELASLTTDNANRLFPGTGD